MITATAELQFQLSQRNIQSILRQLQGRLNVPLNINTDAAQRGLSGINRELNRSAGFANNFGLAIGDSARRFAAYSAGVKIIAEVAQAFKSSAQEALKFDKDLTTLTQVTGKTRDQMAGLTKEILDLSVRTGISAGKLGELTVTLSQAELKGIDLSNALDVIAKSDLAPSFESMEDSVEGLIAIMQQFKRPSTEFAQQFGYINELSKKYAVESKDIIEGVKRSGAVFAAAGASLEEFAAIMTVVRSTTRESAESIATGLKTITERIQRPEIIDYLRELGIELINVEGKFIGPLKAFEALNAGLQKRGSLSTGSLELIAVAKEIGGGRQLSKILPLLTSAGKAREAMEKASKGAIDSLAKDEIKSLKSLSKQIDILKADFNKFVIELSISDEFKEMAQSALDFAKAMVEVAKATKPFIPLMSKLAVAFGTASIVRGFGGQKGSFASAIIPGFADGGKTEEVFSGSGLVRGPGGPKGDGVNARLSDKEFVIKGSSVAKLGHSRLEYINAYGKLPGFADGGPTGTPTSRLAGSVLPLLVFTALSGAVSDLTEKNEAASSSLDKFKAGLIPMIPAMVLLYGGLKKLNVVVRQIGDVAASRNASIMDGPRRRYEQERQDNLNNMRGVNGRPLSRRQRSLADPVTSRVLGAGGSRDEAAAARRAFDRSLNSQDPRVAGNYTLAQRSAMGAATMHRQNRVVGNVANTTQDIANIQQETTTAGANARALAATSAPGFRGLNTAQRAAAIRSRSQRTGIANTLQLGLYGPNADIRAAEDRLRANPRSRASLQKESDRLNNALTTRPTARNPGGTGAAMTPAEVRRAQRRIRVLAPQIADKTTDIRLIQSRKAQIRSVQQSISVLNNLNDLDDRLATATTAQIRATTARANLGNNIAGFSNGMAAGPRTSFLARQRQGLGRVATAAGNNSEAVTIASVALVAFTAALSAGTSAIEKDNTEKAIAAGDAREARRASLAASKEENKSKNVAMAGGVGGGVGSIIGGAIGTAGGPIGIAAGAAIGQAVGSLAGSLLGLTSVVDTAKDAIFGTNTAREQELQALADSTEAQGVALKTLISTGVKKYSTQSKFVRPDGVADPTEARKTLLGTAERSIASVNSIDNRVSRTDAVSDFMGLLDLASADFEKLSQEAAMAGEGFEGVVRRGPDTVKTMDMLLRAIGDPELTDAVNRQIQALQNSGEISRKESAVRAIALEALRVSVLEQNKINKSFQELQKETRSLVMATSSAMLFGQAASGNVSAQPVKDFGVALDDVSNRMTEAFGQTIDALATVNPELRDQAVRYKDLISASSVLREALLSTDTRGKDPSSFSKETSPLNATIFRAFGQAGVGTARKVSQDVAKLLESQAGSDAPSQDKLKEINDFVDKQLQDLTGNYQDNFAKEQSLRTAYLSQLNDLTDRENETRSTLIDNQVESSRRLQEFRDSFVKTTSQSVAAGRRGRTDTILSSVGAKTTGNDASDFQKLTSRRKNALSRIDTLNKSNNIGIINEQEIREKAKLVKEVNILGKALSELTNITEDVSKAQEALAQLEDKQSKLKGKASSLAFGGKDARAEFSRALAAQKFVSAGGNLQDIPEQIRGELQSLLQEFGSSRVFNGESGTEIVNRQTSNFLRSLGYSNDQVNSLLIDMVPVEQKQLDALLEVAKNTADMAANAPAPVAAVPRPAAPAAPNINSLVPRPAASAATQQQVSTYVAGKPIGADKVPAMLGEGEYVVSKDNASKNKRVLDSIQSGMVYADGGLTPMKTPLQLYNENAERLRKAAAAKAISPILLKKLLKKDKSLEGASEEVKDMSLLGFDKVEQLAAEKKQMDKLLAEAPADSSAAARAIGRRAVNAETGNEQINKAYRALGQGYDTRKQTDYGTGGMTTEEIEAVAKKHATDVVSGRLAKDTGGSRIFNKDSTVVFGLGGEEISQDMKHGKAVFTPETWQKSKLSKGQSGLGNKLGINRWEQQSTGFKPAAMLAMADSKANNPEMNARGQRSREKELARIAEYRAAKEAKEQNAAAQPEVAADQPEVATERPTYTPRVRKPIETDRVISSPKSKNKNPIIGNFNVLSEKAIQSRLNAFVDPENIKMTKRSLGFDSKTKDSDFSSEYLTSVNSLTEKYGKIKTFLFGTGEGKVDENMAQSLFSGARYNNGIFHSAQINQEFLAKNKDKIFEIRGIVKDLSIPEDSDLAETAINKASKNAFSKSMKNIMETLDQIREISPEEASLRDSSGLVDPAISRRYDQQQATRHAEFMKDAKGSKKSRRSKRSKGPKGSVEPAALTPEKIEELSQQYGTGGGAAAAVPSSISMSSSQDERTTLQQYQRARDQRLAADGGYVDYGTSADLKVKEDELRTKLQQEGRWNTVTNTPVLGSVAPAAPPAAVPVAAPPVAPPPAAVPVAPVASVAANKAAQAATAPQPSNPELLRVGMKDNTFSIDRPTNKQKGTNVPNLEQSLQMDKDKAKLEADILARKEAANVTADSEKNRQYNDLTKSRQLLVEERQREALVKKYDESHIGQFFNGGIIGGAGGRDNNTASVTRGEGIIQAKTMNKIGPKAFTQLNKTGELPQDQVKSSMDALMKTPPWLKDFQSSVAALAGTSIKAELAPVSVNVKLNGAEVLASIQGQMKDLIKREVLSAVSNMYHDNSGKHIVKGMA